MIDLNELSKEFPGADGQVHHAVRNLTFTVQPGEVFGLLGPNGAGKTTTLRMLCTVLQPTAGSATVAGYDVQRHPQEVRRTVGFLSANTGVYDRMTAQEMVDYYGQLYGLGGVQLHQRRDELFEQLQMNDFRSVVGGRLSTGMKQKVSIARALIHDPPVLIFDEPTNGLDVLVQRAVLDNIARMKSAGKTILLSTHVMREVEKLCDRVAILARGQLVACGTIPDLTQQFNKATLEDVFFALMDQNVPVETN
jgi:sodium transport system ATP-binding protein